MPNEPLPNQLTVGKLRRLIERAPDGAVVALELPAGFRCPAEFATIHNLDVRYEGEPVVRLLVQGAPQKTGAVE